MAEKTLYTALGHFRCRNDGGGRRYPVVLMDHREFGMDPQEMTLWTALCWRLTDRQRAEDFYEQLSNGMELFPRRSFSDCLDRLVTRGLVAKGSGTTDFDALYDLLGGLYVVPISSSFGNVKKCAVGKHPKSEKLGSTGQAACCARIHSRYFTGGSPSGLRV